MAGHDTGVAMTSPDAEFLRALSADCAGRQKLVAAEAFPTKSVADAETEASHILAGRRRLTAAFVLEAMSDPDRTEALRLLADRAGYDLVRRRTLSDADLMEEATAQLAQMQEQLSELRALVTERRAPVRVQPRDAEVRRRA